MKTLTNNELIDLFESNSWDTMETDGRVWAHTLIETNNAGCYIDGSIDVTGWTAEQVEDYFGFNEVPCNESTWDRSRN